MAHFFHIRGRKKPVLKEPFQRVLEKPCPVCGARHRPRQYANGVRRKKYACWRKKGLR